jgi:hypothetical protein
MKLQDYRLIFFVVGLIGILLIASPLLAEVIRIPVGEQFSELYLLGPGHLAENYPYKIVPGQNYSAYLGVGNHWGSSALYMVYVKLLNQTDLLPNATTEAPSQLAPLYQYEFSVPCNQTWEVPLSFSIANVSTSGNQTIINTFTINGVTLNISKPSAWDPKSNKFSYTLTCELWLYNGTVDAFQYHNRYVNLQLNVTETS